MLRIFRRGAAAKIIADAKAMPSPKRCEQNYIGCSGGDPAVITMHLSGKQIGWIEYDRDQLEDLIVMLQRRRAGMK